MSTDLEKALDKDAEESGWVKCPYCGGCGTRDHRGIPVKDNIGVGTVVCWVCNGTGYIPKSNQIQDLVFEAYASDSVSLRQKCIWNYTFLELQTAVENQKSSFERSINEGKEETYIIEEYKEHLVRFSEWSKYFLLEAQSLRSNSTDPSVMHRGV